MCFRYSVPFVKALQGWRVTRATISPYNGHRHRQQEEHKHEERGCKAYPCRLLWRRVAITDGFIHCTPLTSSLGRSFTPSPSPTLPSNPYRIPYDLPPPLCAQLTPPTPPLLAFTSTPIRSVTSFKWSPPNGAKPSLYDTPRAQDVTLVEREGGFDEEGASTVA